MEFEMIQGLCLIISGAISLKSVLIGSDFNFIHWIKYGEKYTTWYFNRPEFNPNDKEKTC